MFKKSVAFALLTAGLMIAPTAAFAGVSQSQNNVQTTEQNGAATNGSTNAQSSNSVNVQKQISNIKSRSRRYGGWYSGAWGKTPHASQAQNSAQKTSQNGAADNNSTNAQTSTTTNNQAQNSAVARNHRVR
jgi:predicted HNH restriction endonuclease